MVHEQDPDGAEGKQHGGRGQGVEERPAEAALAFIRALKENEAESPREKRKTGTTKSGKREAAAGARA